MWLPAYEIDSFSSCMYVKVPTLDRTGDLIGQRDFLEEMRFSGNTNMSLI